MARVSNPLIPRKQEHHRQDLALLALLLQQGPQRPPEHLHRYLLASSSLGMELVVESAYATFSMQPIATKTMILDAMALAHATSND